MPIISYDAEHYGGEGFALLLDVLVSLICSRFFFKIVEIDFLYFIFRISIANGHMIR